MFMLGGAWIFTVANGLDGAWKAWDQAYVFKNQQPEHGWTHGKTVEMKSTGKDG